jgi:hypothetical protein
MAPKRVPFVLSGLNPTSLAIPGALAGSFAVTRLGLPIRQGSPSTNSSASRRHVMDFGG